MAVNYICNEHLGKQNVLEFPSRKQSIDCRIPPYHEAILTIPLARVFITDVRNRNIRRQTSDYKRIQSGEVSKILDVPCQNFYST